MALIYVDVDNPDELLTLFGAGALIRWEWSADASSWSEGGTEPLVSGTTRYVIEHLTATTYYYRSRYSKASPSTAADYSGYSDAWLVGALDAYATLAETRLAIPSVLGVAHDNVLSDLLADAREQTDSDCGRTFLRVPQVTGTVTVHCDVQNGGCSSLVSAIGHPYTFDGRALDIVSVTSLWYRDSETSSYTEIAAGDTGYHLEAGTGPGLAGTDWPYEDITLSPASATRTTFPTGRKAVRIIGVLGFPRVPRAVTRANVDKAREAFRQSVGGGPVQEGVNRFGVPVYSSGLPDSYRLLIKPGSPYLKRSWRAV